MSEPVARTVQGFCAAYGVGKTRAYELIAAGKIEVRKCGTRTLIDEESARQWYSTLSRPLPMSETRKSAEASEPVRKRTYHKSLIAKGRRTGANGSEK